MPMPILFLSSFLDFTLKLTSNLALLLHNSYLKLTRILLLSRFPLDLVLPHLAEILLRQEVLKIRAHPAENAFFGILRDYFICLATQNFYIIFQYVKTLNCPL